MAEIDANGIEWWSASEAAQRWGVSEKRIYKWIKGQKGSRGWRKDAYGNRVKQRESAGSDKKRLGPDDYRSERIGNRLLFMIRAQPYPKPNNTPIDRPTGKEAGQGIRHSEISYDANSSPPGEGYDQAVPDPFIPPYANEEATVYVRPPSEKPEKKKRGPKPKPGAEKAGKKATKKGAKRMDAEARSGESAEPAAPKPPPTPVALTRQQMEERRAAIKQRALEAEKQAAAERATAQIQEELTQYGDLGFSEEKAVQLFNALRADFAARKGGSVRDVTSKMVVAALADRAKREKTTLSDWAGITVFRALLQPLLGDEEEEWTDDPDEVDAVREAFVVFVESIAAKGLDGIRVARGLRGLF